MTATLPNLRYERKFIAQRSSLAEALALVRRHPAAFREAYPARVVNNIYLDSPALSDYFEHVNGAPNRIKTRFRWYGELSGRIATPTLERKIKRGEVSGKLTYPLPALALDGQISRQVLDSALDGAAIPEVLRLALRYLQPSLVNRYRRHYFQSADGRFRLTVDSNLQFFGVRQATGAMVLAPPHAPAVILELKYPSQNAEDAAPVTNALPFRLVRCSKYVLGIESLAAGVVCAIIW